MINQEKAISPADRKSILPPMDIGQRASAVIVTTRCDWASRSTAEKMPKQGARGAGLPLEVGRRGKMAQLNDSNIGLKTLRSNGFEVSVF